MLLAWLDQDFQFDCILFAYFDCEGKLCQIPALKIAMGRIAALLRIVYRRVEGCLQEFEPVRACYRGHV